MPPPPDDVAEADDGELVVGIKVADRSITGRARCPAPGIAIAPAACAPVAEEIEADPPSLPDRRRPSFGC